VATVGGFFVVCPDRDRTHDEPFRRQLDSMPTENQQDYNQLLESSSRTIDNQRKVLALLQSRLREEREEREKLEAQLAELQQNPVSVIDLPEPPDLLNQLKGKRKKSKVELPDVETMLEILEGNR
jgi:septal ring factor EnvC (AmiA/AmiB activator)